MRALLLDTHVVLWLAAEPERLGPALEEVAADDQRLLLSAASCWEVAIKAGLGRLRLPEPVERWLATRPAALGLTHLPVTWQDAAAVADLPPLHRDPIDRLLVAQAQRLEVPLVTADPAVAAYDVQMVAVGGLAPT